MKLGVVGGGQLGRMMAQAALPLGIKTAFLDPAADSCAGGVGQLFCAPYDDPDGLMSLSEFADAITFEFENVPPHSVRNLSQTLPAFPPTQALATARDRWSEKSLFKTLDIETAPLALVDSQDDLDEAVKVVHFPCVLKTRTLGYDGKGQKVLRTIGDVVGTYDELGNVPLLLEGFIDFDYEVSCIAVRDQQGDVVYYPIVRNEHSNGVLNRSQPLLQHPLQHKAESATKKVMDALDYVGAMAFEFFVKGDALVANEIAPRVHNSGHWTIEGTRCSQFENHVRAVMGLPLGSTEVTGPVVMYNMLGKRPDVANLLSIAGLHLHDYGKEERKGRKIGHITLTASSDAALKKSCAQLDAVLVNDV